MMQMMMKCKVTFNPQAIVKRTAIVNETALKRFGAYVKTVSSHSMKERALKKHSPPGTPPYAHMGYVNRKANKALKAAGKPTVKRGFRGLKQMLFAATPKQMIVGPSSNRRREVTVPNILEIGYKGRHKVDKRPYMIPAFKLGIRKLKDFWKP